MSAPATSLQLVHRPSPLPGHWVPSEGAAPGSKRFRHWPPSVQGRKGDVSPEVRREATCSCSHSRAVCDTEPQVTSGGSGPEVNIWPGRGSVWGQGHGPRRQLCENCRYRDTSSQTEAEPQCPLGLQLALLTCQEGEGIWLAQPGSLWELSLSISQSSVANGRVGSL